MLIPLSNVADTEKPIILSLIGVLAYHAFKYLLFWPSAFFSPFFLLSFSEAQSLVRGEAAYDDENVGIALVGGTRFVLLQWHRWFRHFLQVIGKYTEDAAHDLPLCWQTLSLSTTADLPCLILNERVRLFYGHTTEDEIKQENDGMQNVVAITR